MSPPSPRPWPRCSRAYPGICAARSGIPAREGQVFIPAAFPGFFSGAGTASSLKQKPPGAFGFGVFLPPASFLGSFQPGGCSRGRICPAGPSCIPMDGTPQGGCLQPQHPSGNLFLLGWGCGSIPLASGSAWIGESRDSREGEALPHPGRAFPRREDKSMDGSIPGFQASGSNPAALSARSQPPPPLVRPVFPAGNVTALFVGIAGCLGAVSPFFPRIPGFICSSLCFSLLRDPERGAQSDPGGRRGSGERGPSGNRSSLRETSRPGRNRGKSRTG